LLELFNWFVTPFGTEDYLFRKYGIDGRDYTLKGTDPVWTKTGVSEVQYMTVSGIGTPPQPLYMPGQPDLAKDDHAYLKKLMQVTVPLPTIGLVSNAQLEKGASLNQALTDGINDVVTGRKRVADWDGIVKKYLSDGGDTINRQYTEVYAVANG
jgi:putative aldouronate transport system substrate-binding protein